LASAARLWHFNLISLHSNLTFIIARIYAKAGLSLMDERGRHWLWNECYDALVETESRRIMVIGTIQDSSRDN
jgi:hypothetical protein